MTTRTQKRTLRQAYYQRFTPAQRMEHLVLLVSFTVLALTGLPQKYAEQAWAQTLIAALGGVESVRIVHRTMAVLLMAEAIYHGGVLSYKLYVLGVRPIMLPTWRDARDVWDWLRYNLGLRREPPRLPRYNFGEKVEYLAVVWGTIIMVITGFMLWNPIAATKLLPGSWIPAARAAHGAEAVLAVLSILVWHSYNVHLKHFNKSMFVGTLSAEEMEEEHAEELERLQRGESDPVPPPHVIAQRKRVFWPYAVLMSVLLVGALAYFVTFEESAITTVPRLAVEETTLSVDAEAVGVPAEGEALWQQLPCSGCHGERAQGREGLNVPLAGLQLDFADFVAQVRRGPADMPAFPPNQLSDTDLAHLWAWLRSLPAVAPAAP